MVVPVQRAGPPAAPILSLIDPAAVRASRRCGDGRSRPAPGTARYLAPVTQAGRDREQAAAADGGARRLDAMTDLALNDRLSQRSFSGVIGGFDAVDFQERPKGFSALQQLPAGTHCLGPQCPVTIR